MKRRTINLYSPEVIIERFDKAISSFNKKFPEKMTNRNSEIITAINKRTEELNKELGDVNL